MKVKKEEGRAAAVLQGHLAGHVNAENFNYPYLYYPSLLQSRNPSQLSGEAKADWEQHTPGFPGGDEEYHLSIEQQYDLKSEYADSI